jgi:hypothetical protein
LLNLGLSPDGSESDVQSSGAVERFCTWRSSSVSAQPRSLDLLIELIPAEIGTSAVVNAEGEYSLEVDDDQYNADRGTRHSVAGLGDESEISDVTQDPYRTSRLNIRSQNGLITVDYSDSGPGDNPITPAIANNGAETAGRTALLFLVRS